MIFLISAMSIVSYSQDVTKVLDGNLLHFYVTNSKIDNNKYSNKNVSESEMAQYSYDSRDRVTVVNNAILSAFQKTRRNFFDDVRLFYYHLIVNKNGDIVGAEFFISAKSEDFISDSKIIEIDKAVKQIKFKSLYGYNLDHARIVSRFNKRIIEDYFDNISNPHQNNPTSEGNCELPIKLY